MVTIHKTNIPSYFSHNRSLKLPWQISFLSLFSHRKLQKKNRLGISLCARELKQFLRTVYTRTAPGVSPIIHVRGERWRSWLVLLEAFPALSVLPAVHHFFFLSFVGCRVRGPNRGLILLYWQVGWPGIGRLKVDVYGGINLWVVWVQSRLEFWVLNRKVLIFRNEGRSRFQAVAVQLFYFNSSWFKKKSFVKVNELERRLLTIFRIYVWIYVKILLYV